MNVAPVHRSMEHSPLDVDHSRHPPNVSHRQSARPTLDEPCPEWVRPFLDSIPEQQGTGVPLERIPEQTLDALHYFFPPAAQRKKKRTTSETPHTKTYRKLTGTQLYLSCLPYALSKQLTLPPQEQQSSMEYPLAILSFRRLADLAAQIGISYDRVQRWMSVLLVLGFLKRYREGKRVLYVLPLTPYIPEPSPEVIQKKLGALIESQYVQELHADGSIHRRDRCPEFTRILQQVRMRFELRYQPPLSSNLELPPTFHTLIREVQQALPQISHGELAALLPVLNRYFFSVHHAGARYTPLESPLQSSLSPFHADTFSSEQRTTPDAPPEIDAAHHTRNESLPASQNLEYQGLIPPSFERQVHTESPPAQHLLDSLKKTSDAISGFESAIPSHPPHTSLPLSRSQGASHATQTAHRSRMQTEQALSNPDMGSDAPPLTLRSLCNTDSQKERNENVTAAAEKPYDEQDWQRLGLELATLFHDEKSLRFFVGIHRTCELELLRAIFIKTMMQKYTGGYRTSAAAYFCWLYKLWSPLRTYRAACEKWNRWGKKRQPQGIPPDVQHLVRRFEGYSYRQIAEALGQQDAGREFDQEARTQGLCTQAFLSYPEARALPHTHLTEAGCSVEQSRIPPVSWPGTPGYVIDGETRQQERLTCASREEWRRSCTALFPLPEPYEQWLAEMRTRVQERCNDEDEQAVRRALTLLSDLPDVVWWRFSWDELVRLGRPLCPTSESRATEQTNARAMGLQEQASGEGEASAVIPAHPVFTGVEMEDGMVLPYEAYEQLSLRAEALRHEEEQVSTLKAQLAQLHQEREHQDAVFPATTEGKEAQEEGMSRSTATSCIDLLVEQVDREFYGLSLQPVVELPGEEAYAVRITSRLTGHVWMVRNADELSQLLSAVNDASDTPELQAQGLSLL